MNWLLNLLYLEFLTIIQQFSVNSQLVVRFYIPVKLYIISVNTKFTISLETIHEIDDSKLLYLHSGTSCVTSLPSPGTHRSAFTKFTSEHDDDLCSSHSSHIWPTLSVDSDAALFSSARFCRRAGTSLPLMLTGPSFLIMVGKSVIRI